MRPLVSVPCRLALASALLLLAGACREGSSEFTVTTGGDSTTPETENVVLILVDDWALSDLEAARTDAAPWNDLLAVDSLAAVGQSWDNFYAQPICNPTRATLMFGRYVGANLTGVCNPPTAETPRPGETLASMFRDAGFATGTFGKWHISRDPDPGVPWTEAPASYGFDAWRAWNASNLKGHCESSGYEDWHRVDDGVVTRSSAYHTEAVALAFLDWWQGTSGSRFAYVNFQAPHAPMHHPPAHLLPTGYPPSTNDRERYEAMLVALDTLLASMLAVIDLSDTAVFLLGDNGTPPNALRDDQSPGRVKRSTFEDGVNVPFVVAGPGISVGTVEALGHVVDLPATLAALTGVSPPTSAFADSTSLAPVLQGRAERVREHLVCDRLSRTVTLTPFGEFPLLDRTTCVVLETPQGLLKGVFDLEETYDVRNREIVLEETERVYDLAVDPREVAPLGASDPVRAEDVARLEEIWRSTLNGE